MEVTHSEPDSSHQTSDSDSEEVIDEDEAEDDAKRRYRSFYFLSKMGSHN